MYHISNDARAVRSAKKIGNGILKCLENKKFTEITVTDVQKASLVGRATFYRLFDNTSDVLSYLCDGVFEQASTEYEKSADLSADRTTLTFIRIWEQNKVLLKAIVDCNRTDFILRSHMKYLLPSKQLFFGDLKTDEAQAEYLMAVLTACTSAILTAWLANGAKENALEVQQRLKGCFKTLGAIFD